MMRSRDRPKAKANKAFLYNPFLRCRLGHRRTPLISFACSGLDLSGMGTKPLGRFCSATYQATAHGKEALQVKFPSKSQIKHIRRNFSAGSHVELIRMDDPAAPPIGTHGTVIAVDEIGSILVDWDSGSSLSVAYGADSCRQITE